MIFRTILARRVSPEPSTTSSRVVTPFARGARHGGAGRGGGVEDPGRGLPGVHRGWKTHH